MLVKGSTARCILQTITDIHRVPLEPSVFLAYRKWSIANNLMLIITPVATRMFALGDDAYIAGLLLPPTPPPPPPPTPHPPHPTPHPPPPTHPHHHHHQSANKIDNIFIQDQENVLENVICEVMVILSLPRYVNCVRDVITLSLSIVLCDFVLVSCLFIRYW